MATRARSTLIFDATSIFTPLAHQNGYLTLSADGNSVLMFKNRQALARLVAAASCLLPKE